MYPASLTECTDALAGDGSGQRRQRDSTQQADGVVSAQVAAFLVAVQGVRAADEEALVAAGRLTGGRRLGEVERVGCEHPNVPLGRVVPAIGQLCGWGKHAGQVRGSAL